MRLEWMQPAAVMVVALGLSGCFGSRQPLIEPKDSVMAFGAEGRVKRVMYDQIGGPFTETVRFVWRQNAYVIELPRRGPEPDAYRLSKLEGDWLIWQKFDSETAAYGLARREGNRLWAYAPECDQLSEKERAALRLAVSTDGTCWIRDAEQLRGAMRALAARTPKVIGYYEVEILDARN